MPRGELDEREQMALVAVHAIWRNQPDEMQRGVARLAALDGIDERPLFEEISVVDAFVDAGQVLVHHSAGAHRHVADFRIPHLPGRQTDRLTRGRERRVRETIEQLAVRGRARELDGVVFLLLAQTPPIEDDEHQRSADHERAASCRMAERPA